MEIRGKVEYKIYDSEYAPVNRYEFVLKNINTITYCETTLSFENGYDEFKYEFESLEDFLEQYKEQKTNLFKVFFNDNTIDFDSLEYDVEDYEWIEICSTYNTYVEYPTIDRLVIDPEHFSYHIGWIVDDDFELQKDNKEFYWVVKSLNYYIEEEYSSEWILSETLINFSFSNLSIDEIQELHKNNELKALLDFYKDCDGEITQSERDYINLAVNFNNDGEKIKIA